MSKINQILEGRFNAVRQDATYRPAIDRVKQAAKPGVTSDEILNVAVAATVDSFKRQGRKLDKNDVREAAFLAAAAASMEQPFELKDLPAGNDKTKHFLTSGFLSLKLADAADVLLPRRAAEWVGEKLTMGLGWAKEVYDMAFATGYNTDDLKADFAGARRPARVAVPSGN